MMYKIHAIDPLVPELQRRLPENQFQFACDETAQGIFVRSSVVPDELLTDELLAVARAGIGVNTINVERCTENGTVVFNTPGVNANAVKELVMTCLLLSVRPLFAAMEMVQTLKGEDILVQAEKRRQEFVGGELEGKVVGILGLGAIGRLVAEACDQLGMEVIGYDLVAAGVECCRQKERLEDVLQEADFVVIHLPLTEATLHLISERELSLMKDEAVLLNFGRGPVVDNQALLQALEQESLRLYISDFPAAELLHHEKILLLPHIGGTTNKALEVGAQTALKDLREYLLYGTIRYSVNFPTGYLPFDSPTRLALYYRDRPKIFAEISQLISQAAIEINILTSDRRGSYVYTLIDIEAEDQEVVQPLVEKIRQIDGMIRVRALANPASRKKAPLTAVATAIE